MEKIKILHTFLCNNPMDDNLQDFENKIQNRLAFHYGCFCDANLCVLAYRDAQVKQYLDAAEYVFPDGAAMTAGAKCLGKKFCERQPGPDSMIKICKFGSARKVRHFFYGGSNEEQMNLFFTGLKKQVPDVEISGYYIPPFRPLTAEEDEFVMKQINDSDTDILWVGLGAPKQEKWLYEHREKLHVPLAFGVGAAFDFLAGTRKRAPKWIRKIGCEWLYRMLTGGKRVFLRNLKQESSFVILIFKQMFLERLLRKEL